MNNQTFSTLVTELAGQARTRAAQAGDRVQKRAFVAAGVVGGIKNPARKLNTAGQKLNDLGHRYYTKLLKQQIKSFEDTVNAGTARLKAVGDATSLRELVQAQIALFPTNRDGFVANLRTTAGIVGETGVEIGKLAKATLIDIKGGKAEAKKPKATATKAAATKTVKKTTTKKTAPKKAAPKSAAKKTT